MHQPPPTCCWSPGTALNAPPHSSKHPPCHSLPRLPTHVLPEHLSFSGNHDDLTFLLLFCPKLQASAFLILYLIPMSSTAPGLTQKPFVECVQLSCETLPKKSSKALDNEEVGSIKVLSTHGAIIKDRAVGGLEGASAAMWGTLCRHMVSLLM